jgi:uncharacterized membrane protein YesL
LNFLNGKIYAGAEFLTGLIVLNLLWLIACIPVVTAFPATTAMFGVAREWVRDSDTATFEPFIRHLRANFAQSLWIGFIWTSVGALLAIDFIVIRGIGNWLKMPLFMLLGLGIISYLFASVYLFPVMVNYEAGWRNVIQISFLIAIGQLATTLLCLLVVGLSIVLLYFVPILGLVAGSGTAYLIYFLCGRAFSRIEAQKGLEL